MSWWPGLVGAALVLFVLHDIFHTLWHPTGRGPLTGALMRTVWRVATMVPGRRPLELAGPLAMVLVVASWTLVVVLGYALVYWPHMPAGFSFAPPLDVSRRSSFLDSVYVSLVTLSTLGYGDVVPRAGWLRVVAPVQALIGFALLTAAVSWVLQVYPALARRRALAIRLSMLRENDGAGGLLALQETAAAGVLDEISRDLIQIRVDLTQYAETYYYGESDVRASLPAALGYVLALVEAGTASPSASVRFSAEALRQAVNDFCVILRDRHGRHGADADEILRDYARQHRHTRLDAAQ